MFGTAHFSVHGYHYQHVYGNVYNTYVNGLIGCYIICVPFYSTKNIELLLRLFYVIY
jgi:hypothetical protein